MAATTVQEWLKLTLDRSRLSSPLPCVQPLLSELEAIGLEFWDLLSLEVYDRSSNLFFDEFDVLSEEERRKGRIS